jgi:hypothetical protein
VHLSDPVEVAVRSGAVMRWSPASECVLVGAGEQAGAYVADDVGGEAVQVMPADLAALAGAVGSMAAI